MIIDNYVDIHSHIIPNVDDGAESYEAALQMIRMSYEEGCRHLFLTPHGDAFNQRNGIKSGAKSITDKFSLLQQYARDEGIDINLYMGSEIYFDPTDDEDAKDIIRKIKKGRYPTMNGSRYVMLEFYLGGFELDEVAEDVMELISSGYRPIIAHAERYGVSKDVIMELREMGCLIQINLCDVMLETQIQRESVQDRESQSSEASVIKDAFAGWGSEMINMTHSLLSDRCVDFVGTDAHGIDRRSPAMRDYIAYLYSDYPEEYIDDILYNNAERLLKLNRG